MRYHIDTHVHLYHCYDAAAILVSASNRLAMPDAPANLVLCLTESAGFNFYQILVAHAREQTLYAGYTITRLDGNPALLLSRNGEQIIIIAGRQVVSSDKLEVLALYCDYEFQDGTASQKIIDDIADNGGIAVLPWGVGKWLGDRGHIVTRLLQENSPSRLAIADISSRPFTWPLPSQFRLADKLGYNTLYGTDPLPLTHDQERVASAGMLADLPAEKSSAVAQLKTMLLSSPFQQYGSRVSTLRFIRDQVMLRGDNSDCLQQSAG